MGSIPVGDVDLVFRGLFFCLKKSEEKMKSILIKDTTREEREKIVQESLGCGSDCSMCCACGSMEINYDDYIEGRKELRELNAEYSPGTMIGH